MCIHNVVLFYTINDIFSGVSTTKTTIFEFKNIKSLLELLTKIA